MMTNWKLYGMRWNFASSNVYPPVVAALRVLKAGRNFRQLLIFLPQQLKNGTCFISNLFGFCCDIMLLLPRKPVFLEKAASLSCIFSIAYKKYKSKAS
jgi:hypothetical protein